VIPAVEMVFGSRLYGTATPESDTDIKGVFLPTAEEIVFGRADRTIHAGTKSDQAAKNSPDDVDRELYSLRKFLGMVLSGQTVAVEMLFAPASAYISAPKPAWKTLVENRGRLISRNTKAFLGYVRRQAAKYGIKGSRVAAAREVVDILSQAPGTQQMTAMRPLLLVASASSEHIKLIEVEAYRDGPKAEYLEVCDRKFMMSLRCDYVADSMQKIVDTYGQRALAAEKESGIDWKALSHAVRVAFQTHELLTTGELTLPRPEAHLLINIKLGQKKYVDVAKLIEKLATLVESSVPASVLPEEPDTEWAHRFDYEVHSEIVRKG